MQLNGSHVSHTEMLIIDFFVMKQTFSTMASAETPPVDTPPGDDGRRKSGRRSWFTPGKAVKLEFAVQPPSPEAQPAPDDDMETLILTHFTPPPRIDFGQLLPGKTSRRRLRVHNPNEYDQYVVIEKFPYKKFFAVDEEEFVVQPANDLILNLEWSPDEPVMCREMVTFKVDGVYRLHAIFFGSVRAPPKPKKV